MTQKQRIYCLSLSLLLAAIPILAVSMPRGVAFLPGLIGVIFMALYPFVYGARPRFARATFAAAFVTGVLALASATWSLQPASSLHFASNAVLVMVSGCFLVSLALTLRPEDLKPSLWLVPFSILISSLLIAIEMRLGSPFFRAVRHMPPGSYVNVAEFNRALVIVALLFFPAIAILRNYFSRLWVAALVFCTMAYTLYIADTQSAQLALLLGAITWAIFPYRSKAAWIALAAVFFLLMLAAPFIFIWTFDHIAHSIDDIPGMGRGGAYAGARIELWDYVSRYMLQNPLYGFGFEATRMVPHFDSAEIFQKGTTILHPHNFVLQIWMEFGLLGILIAGTMMTMLLLTMQKHLSVAQARIALPTLIAVMSVGSTAYGFWQGWWLGTLFLTASITILATRSVPSPLRGEG